MADQITTASKTRPLRRLGIVSSDDLVSVERVVRLQLGLIPAARDADLFRPGRKTFFFEKKKQETFGYWDPRQPKAEAQ